jgi:D-alanine-D-alanine ligase
MKIAVLYNTAAEGGFLAEDIGYAADAIATANRIYETLNKGGHEVRLVEISKKKMKKQLQEIKRNNEVVFNLTEGKGWDLVLGVVKELEELDIAFAGATTLGYKLSSDKTIMKGIYKRLGIPTPDWKTYTEENINEKWEYGYPAIVKSTTEHGSMSIHQDAVVKEDKTMKTRIKYLLTKYNGSPVIVEKYIKGREINSTVIGSFEWAKCLPLSEVVFEGIYKVKGEWPIYTYEAKYNHGTQEFKDAPAKLVDWLTPKETTEIEKMTLRLCEETESFDYVRTDIRYDMEKRIPYFIDLNSYPCLLDDPIDDTITVSRLAWGWDYLKILEEIAKSAIMRNNKKT